MSSAPLPPVLLQIDEEVDLSVYGAYLRAQTDTDLLDIARHLSPHHYPARLDAAGRELRRRGLLQISAYTPAETVFRYFALAALALAAVTLLLAALLTPAQARGPAWPTGAMLPEGIPMSAVALLFLVALLRGVVVWSAHFGLYPMLIILLTVWAATRANAVRRRRARADVWRLVCLGLAVLLGAAFLAAGPRSAVPLLFGVPAAAPLLPSAAPLLNPFDSGTPPENPL